MHALRFHEFGGFDKLNLETIPDPQPGAGEVVVVTRDPSVAVTGLLYCVLAPTCRPWDKSRGRPVAVMVREADGLSWLSRVKGAPSCLAAMLRGDVGTRSRGQTHIRARSRPSGQAQRG